MLDFRKGDAAYVIGRGSGKVSMVLPDGSFDVNIEGYGDIHFNPDGTIGNMALRRVYYDDPVVVEPIKNERLWRTYVKMAKVLFAELAALDAVGEIPDA
ncbi:MAG: hypothetical protein LBQ79_00440 [Deltaproteobacteria bacterium]|jgi:hypothetical protein|nr:hypothetical protein [Deltaproteobacteria bacterium]